jgi:hypothetical protein
VSVSISSLYVMDNINSFVGISGKQCVAFGQKHNGRAKRALLGLRAVSNRDVSFSSSPPSLAKDLLHCRPLFQTAEF